MLKETMLQPLITITEGWFKWLKWALATAALSAIAEKSGSIFLKIPAWISFCLITWITYLAIEQFYDSLLPSPTRVNRYIGRLLVLLIVATQLMAMFVLSKIIEVALK
jgi:hypothetical protein